MRECWKAVAAHETKMLTAIVNQVNTTDMYRLVGVQGVEVSDIIKLAGSSSTLTPPSGDNPALLTYGYDIRNALQTAVSAQRLDFSKSLIGRLLKS